jgi:hypothetical protein
VQGAATALMSAGGLVLSFACAVLLEELFIGGLFRLFFAPRPVAGQKRGSGQKR